MGRQRKDDETQVTKPPRSKLRQGWPLIAPVASMLNDLVRCDSAQDYIQTGEGGAGVSDASWRER